MDLTSFLNTEVLNRRDALASTFQDAQPFRHVVIDGFFEPAFCESLVDAFPPFDPKLAMNEDGVVGGKAVHENVRTLGPAYERLDALVASPEFRGLIGTITGIPELEYDKDYFGGGTHDNRHGQELDAHIDFNFHPITGMHRRLNLIVFFNDGWRPEWGGVLDLHKNPRRRPHEDEITSVVPLMNRCVVFETNEYSWHGFEKIQLPDAERDRSRRSFALYYYTRTRPAEETGNSHSTVYVERHLPPRFKAGYTLSGNDEQELLQILKRRDTHLQRLYGYVANLLTEVDSVKSAIRVADEADVPAAAEADATTDGTTEVDAETRASLRRLTEANRILRWQLNGVLTSKSWKLTEPLRSAMAVVKRVAGR
jgi:hypothetical protein